MNKYRLMEDVFYRLVDNEVLLYKTDTSNVYVYTKELLEILNQFNKNIFVEPVCKDTQFLLFLDLLVDEGILEKPKELIENKNDIESQEKNKGNNKLYSAMFELTYRCNEKCRYCYCIADNRKEMTKEKIFKVIDDLYKMGVIQITFTGGDLFVRPDSIEIIEYAYQKGFVVDVFTNGLLVSDTDLIKLRACHLRSLSVSIYSHIPEIHDWFTQVNGSFEKSLLLLKKAKLMGIPINIKTTVLSINHENIDKVLELASNLGATIQVSMSISVKNNGDKSSKQYAISSIEDYISVMKKVGNAIRVNNFETLNPVNYDNLDRLDICGAGKHSISINPYGEVYPCNALLIKCGDINEESIIDIWNRSKELDEIRKYTMDKVKGCKNCTHIKYCSFCPGNALLEQGDPLKKYEGACMTNVARNIFVNNNKKGGE